MSNILKKDRKPSEMKVIIHGEEIAKEIMKIVNDDSRIPKRQRYTIGNRLIDHSMNSYEALRAANSIYPNTKKKISQRIKLGQEAEIEANKLNSDIRILPSVINVIDNITGKESKWYKELNDKTITYEKELNHWNRGELSRANKVYSSSLKSTNDSNKKDISIEIKQDPVSKIINIDDINDKNYIKNKIQNNA